MLDEVKFTLYSNDKEKIKFNFLFKIEIDGKLTIEAQEQSIHPNIYECSFTKEDFYEKTGILLKEQQKNFARNNFFI